MAKIHIFQMMSKLHVNVASFPLTLSISCDSCCKTKHGHCNHLRYKSTFQLTIREFFITFVMSVIEKFTKFLNTLMMKYELRSKCWIKDRCNGFICASLSLLIILLSECMTFLFEKFSCAAEILILSDSIDFITNLLEMP